MNQTVTLGEPFRRPSRTARILAALRRYLLSGILVTAPIGFTLYLTWAVVSFFDRRVLSLLPPSLDPSRVLPAPYGVPGLGLLLVVLALILVGWVAGRAIGRSAMRVGERVVEAVPIVRSIYATLKKVAETVLSDQSAAFRQVVLLEYPRRGIWSMAFVTGTTRGAVQALTNDEVVNVFLPTTPNPTSGYLLFVPKKEVIPLDMSVEDGIKMIISAGIDTPVPAGRPAPSPLPEGA